VGQPPSVVRGSEARDLPANRVELRSSETAEGGCSPWPLVAPQSNSRLSLSATPGGRQPVPWAALGLCCRNCHRCIRLAATALVGGGMDRLCVIRRVPAPAAWPAGIHRRIGCLLFLGALMVQVRGLEGAGKSSWTRFADGTDVCGPRHQRRNSTRGQSRAASAED
jgi:hypothetical protein